MLTLQGRLKDSQFNLNEFQTSTLPTQYELTKTIHEKNLLAEQVKYLEAELQKKSQEDRALRAESARKTDELSLALAEATAQLDAANKQLATVKVQLSFNIHRNGLSECVPCRFRVAHAVCGV
jgi:regulatory protein YycI of two-component signal transduction system YycFG